jgi:4a-hydroxytetrahydrobiopterin dehydratase
MKLQPIEMDDKPCDGDKQRRTGGALHERHEQLKGGWKLIGEEELQKEFKFPDFCAALQFTNRVGEIAELLNHHPDIYLTYGLVRLKISTHSLGGLTDCDFKLAAKVNELKSSPAGTKDIPV